MDFDLQSLTTKTKTHGHLDAWIVLVPEGWAGTDDSVGRWAEQIHKAGDLPAKLGKVLQTYQVDALPARRMICVGAGSGSAKDIKAAVTAATTALKGSDIQRLALHMGALGALDAAQLRAAMVAVSDASYVYTTSLSQPKGRKLRQVQLWVGDAAPLRLAFASAQALVQGLELTREWANRPANYATPSLLAQQARRLAKLPRVSCEVMGLAALKRLKMGAFLAVAQGSAQPPQFIVLKYQGAAASSAPIVLVGKGITFDTGGISLKPAPEMDEMKFDMSGAACVLGVFQALALARPALNVIGLIPSCENMPDGLAVKPGDVVTSMSGQTIEILNTDAEGRLILCDALTYARRFKPRAVIDIATLTGACVIALGAVRSGLFSTDDALAQALHQAGEAAQDPCWRMPLDDEYAEGLKTSFADVANVAGRAAGSVTAAKFLQRFTQDLVWAHLDIAGTAWKSGPAKGATGRPVALLYEYLCQQAQTPAESAKSAKPTRSAKR